MDRIDEEREVNYFPLPGTRNGQVVDWSNYEDSHFSQIISQIIEGFEEATNALHVENERIIQIHPSNAIGDESIDEDTDDYSELAKVLDPSDLLESLMNNKETDEVACVESCSQGQVSSTEALQYYESVKQLSLCHAFQCEKKNIKEKPAKKVVVKKEVIEEPVKEGPVKEPVKKVFVKKVFVKKVIVNEEPVKEEIVKKEIKQEPPDSP